MKLLKAWGKAAMFTFVIVFYLSILLTLGYFLGYSIDTQNWFTTIIASVALIVTASFPVALMIRDEYI